MKKLEPKILIRNLLVELLIYSVLIVSYYFIVLRWLGNWFYSIFQSNLVVYALAGLGLILVQGAILDLITSFLMKYIKLDQFGIRRFLDVFSRR